jgi:DNA-binding NarL/FixJ family response regulator
VLSTYRRAAGEHRSDTVAELTARERDVLTLIGQGRSNTEISDELCISQATVKSHIGRIFLKLDLRDRAAAIVYAYDHGIVTPVRHLRFLTDVAEVISLSHVTCVIN